MDQTPLISIITITFNAGEVISPTLKSVSEQTCRDFEHIIVDGASTDETLSLARTLGGRDIRILSEPDKGLYDAMNKGLKLAKGKYVIFLNAGDAFHTPATLAEYHKACLTDPDIVYADTVVVDADRNFLAPRHLSAPDVLTFKSFEKGMLICHQAFMVKRRLAPSYDTEYRFSADFDWCVNCIKKSKPEKCINLHMVAIDYLSDGLTDKNKVPSLKERFRIMRKHYGIVSTVTNHFSFIKRALKRRMS